MRGTQLSIFDISSLTPLSYCFNINGRVRSQLVQHFLNVFVLLDERFCHCGAVV